MQVSLFRALRSANIAEDAAEKVVHAFEEHIDMAVPEAMKHYENRITAMQAILETKIDSALKGIEGKLEGMKTSVDGLRSMIVIQTSVLAVAAVAAALVKVFI